MKEKPTILAVDDQIQNLELLEAYLVPRGYDIITAANGEEAMEKLSAIGIDLVLLDIMMPGMDGFEVTRRIRQNEDYRQLPIILVTALKETEDRVRGIDAGCDDFISKPFDRMELLARVKSLLQVKAYNDLLSCYRKELESEVAERTRELAEINADLEKKVYERTKELKDEKDKLNERNLMMETDLDMARKIQKCFIPGKSPAPYISFIYKPMEKVGGDFFDFIQFPEDDKIGIFISDVSGHGVPAAFITAMIKSTLLQFSSHYSSPSMVLAVLNDILINQSSQNFITTFYGCYKIATGELIYSSAGHNHPYLVSGENIEYLDIKNHTPPLAIMTNTQLINSKKLFKDETVILEKGTKLVLYTDGLTEAYNINDTAAHREDDFEKEKLHGSFRKHFNKPSELFLKGVYQDLISFRGCDNFEDDLCVICVDVL
jgi:serine phosphatase RsbU (regulator of sigma subunit)